jgi:small multidrug resistance family-3 protein
MASLPYFAAAALLEILGCFCFWAWLRLGKSAWLALPGALSLLGFAWLLTLPQVAFAGRAYAAYGGVYIVASLAWLLTVERALPDRWDMLGALLCVAGALVILLGPRAA